MRLAALISHPYLSHPYLFHPYLSHLLYVSLTLVSLTRVSLTLVRLRHGGQLTHGIIGKAGALGSYRTT
jgi:hypothetical protein